MVLMNVKKWEACVFVLLNNCFDKTGTEFFSHQLVTLCVHCMVQNLEKIRSFSCFWKQLKCERKIYELEEKCMYGTLVIIYMDLELRPSM